MPETYLGDGVYATLDNCMIKLDLREQDDSVIFLEPEVLVALIRFATRHNFLGI